MNRIARNTLIAACTAAALVLAGCAAVDPARIPAIDTAGSTTRLPGKIVWHDLLSEDPAAAKRFYGGLFGWTFRDVDIGGGQTYTVIAHAGRAIGGMVDGRGINRGINVSRWIPVLSVADLDAAVAAVHDNGGNVFQAPVEIPERGRVAVVGDPQGAVLTLLQSRDGDPPDRPIPNGGWLWNELWSSDPRLAIAFYRRLLPAYQEASAKRDAYTYLESQGQPRVGVLPNPVSGIKDTWMAYVRVADPAATAAAAERLGGQVLLPARKNPLGGEVAILNDPTGAGFLVQSWEPSWAEHTTARHTANR
ncbi:MAG: VOC family protein [Thiohalocapsa sp.]|uniref:VOC family protein n=1 Tax=Thiohalocapsa sp. TaxID=2497641 RepID=UPI0025F4A48F|nr:VOC family protein [Thiohalocapsa sp.]MCG6942358.1 VOC family protein [Thiohalocapsa sp.]